MAKNIPIWAGSSSFFPGDTPFGLYDNDVKFQSDVDKVSDWCAKRLGYPITDIELQPLNFFACFEEAISEYGAQVNTYNIRDNMLNLYGSATDSNLSGQKVSPNFGGLVELAEEYGTEAGSGGNVTYFTGSVSMSKSTQIYDLTDSSIVSLESGTAGTDEIEIKRIYHEAPPAIVKYFDPFVGTGLGSQQMLDNFGFGGFSPGVSFMMMPLYYDLARFQAIEFNDQIRKSGYSFQLVNDRLRVYPIPNGSNFTKIHFDYILKSDRSNALKGKTGTVSDFSNVPYENVTYANINAVGKQWIRRYTLALSKELLGIIRSKYQTMPIPNGEVTMDGEGLKAEGREEKQLLLDELKEFLDSVTLTERARAEQEQAESQQQVLNKSPLKIYLG